MKPAKVNGALRGFGAMDGLRPISRECKWTSDHTLCPHYDGKAHWRWKYRPCCCQCHTYAW